MENMFSSLHTHTIFCDGKDDVETMCAAAYEKGLAAIGFSAHAPVGRTGLVTNWHLKDSRLEEYAGEVCAARRRWEGRLAVYLGLEVDYIKGLRSPLDSDICMRGVHTPSLQTKLDPLLSANAPEGRAARGRRKFLGLPAVGDERVKLITKGKEKADQHEEHDCHPNFRNLAISHGQKKAGQRLRRRTPPDFAAPALPAPPGDFRENCGSSLALQGGVFDYIIGSVHYLVPPCGEPFTVDGPVEEMEKGIAAGFGGDSEAMMHAYWDAVLEMIAVGGFDIVGHIDLIKKTNDDFNGGQDSVRSLGSTGSRGRWFSREGGAYMRRFEEVAAAVSASGLVVELSTGALNRRYHSETYPSLPLLRILRRRNVPVMISADAHRAADLDGFYPQAMEMLHKAGYESHVVFEGRQNGSPQWKTVSK